MQDGNGKRKDDRHGDAHRLGVLQPWAKPILHTVPECCSCHRSQLDGEGSACRFSGRTRATTTTTSSISFRRSTVSS